MEVLPQDPSTTTLGYGEHSKETLAHCHGNIGQKNSKKNLNVKLGT